MADIRRRWKKRIEIFVVTTRRTGHEGSRGGALFGAHTRITSTAFGAATTDGRPAPMSGVCQKRNGKAQSRSLFLEAALQRFDFCRFSNSLLILTVQVIKKFKGLVCDDGVGGQVVARTLLCVEKHTRCPRGKTA